MRYGVLHDIGSAIAAGEPVDASVGHFNCLWQCDANNQALLCLDHCESPAAIMNVTGPEMLETKAVAEELGRLMGKAVTYRGEDAGIAYLNNAAKATKLFGEPTVKPDQLIKWQAAWLSAGGSSLGKPTHFEVNTGKF
jgi:nucleoside-diphosphate-sugar epimerase